MPEDYYSDGPTPSTGITRDEKSGGDEGEDSPHDTGVTAVVPSELCPGMKVGDEMVVKILSVDDDSYEVAYAPDKGKPKAEEPESEGEAQVPEGSMASMME
jgi:hypothetical protein